MAQLSLLRANFSLWMLCGDNSKGLQEDGEEEPI